MTEAKPGRRQGLLGHRLMCFSPKAIICYKVIFLVKKMNSRRPSPFGELF